MPLNNDLFIPLNYFQEYFVDKTAGLPLSGGYVFTWQDINRNNPKPLYEISGSPPNYTYTPLPNPIILTNVGTFADSSGNDVTAYAYPYDAAGNPDNYYVSVFAAATAPPFPPLGTPEFTRENVPGVTTSIGPNVIGPQSIENLLVNSQFSQILFSPSSGLTISYSSGTTTTQIAPGWYLQIASSGSGNVLVTRTALAGNNNFATNPPYSLTINPMGGGGIQSLILFQRLQGNPNIFAGGVINVGLAIGPNTQPITVYYAPQGMLVLPAIATFATTISGQWQYENTTTLDPLAPGANTATGDTGYVDIQFYLTPNAITTLSSMQLVFLGAKNSGPGGLPITNVPYNQVPVIDQISGNSFFYEPLLAYKPIPSYLVGWDFPLNPGQFGTSFGPFGTGVNTGNYVLDQTIVYQTLNNGFTSAKDSTNGSLLLTSNGTGQVAIIQYLDKVEARKILSDRSSVHMSLYGNIGGGATGHVTLWATTNGTVPTLTTTFITTLAADGTPASVAAGWVQVPNVYNNTKFTVPLISATDSESIDINLNGWDMADAVPTNTATFFAIVVGFTQWTNGDTINVNSIALCPGDIATRPAPKTVDETLRVCEHYYEMSYQNSAAVNTATFVNSLSFPQNASIPTGMANNSYLMPNGFTIKFSSLKRTASPTLSLYDPTTNTGAGFARIQTVVNTNIISGFQATVSSNWTQTGLGNKYVAYTPNTNISGSPIATAAADRPLLATLLLHYIADARLGVVT